MKRLALAALALLALAAPGPFDPRSSKLPDDAPIAITAEAMPLPKGFEGLRDLKPVAALRLRSDDLRFGGLSSLVVASGGSFVSVSDRAYWLKGRIAEAKNGGVEGLADTTIGLLRDEDGQPPNPLRGDSEGLTRLKDGRYAVSFERDARVELYDFAKHGSGATPTPGPKLLGLENLVENQQLEAVATLPDGRILIGAERGPNGDDKTPLWITEARADAPPAAPVATIDLPFGFSLTDLSVAPDGAVFALLRAYSPLTGARAQIRRYVLSEKDGKIVLTGEVLADIAPPYPTDNFEGIAVTAAPGGGQRIYVISDDNYRAAQATILLVFDWKPGKAAPA